MLYRNIGSRINIEILNEKRAEYGKQIVASLSQELTQKYGSGCGVKQLLTVFALQKLFLIFKFCTLYSELKVVLKNVILSEVKNPFFFKINELDSSLRSE